jgi:hypothetical protein
MSIGLTITVNGTVVRTVPPIPFTSGMNAQNALEAAYVSGGSYSFLLQYYGALGYEVTTIDQIAAQQGTDAAYYWQFFYNGQSAQQGIDETFLNDGDQLDFAYTCYDMTLHAGTRLEAIHRARGGKTTA